jgi:ElaA protein
MLFKLKKFQQLSAQELYQILQLRSEVFVVEQNCPYLDPDGKDLEALHLMGLENDVICAYARILKPGVCYKETAIGRVVVAPKERGKKYGYELMKQAIAACEKAFGSGDIVISAQKYLEKFYNELGFLTESDTYLEDDIPHIKMRYKNQIAVSTKSVNRN